MQKRNLVGTVLLYNDLTNHCLNCSRVQLSQLDSHLIDSDTALSLAYNLSRITNSARDDIMVSGDLYTAVDILQTLGQKTANMTLNKEKAEQFMKVSI